jgi:hypothetical protein
VVVETDRAIRLLDEEGARDLLFSFARIDSPALRLAALRCVQALADQDRR